MKRIILLPLLAILIVVQSCANGQAQNTKLNAKEFAAKIEELPGATILDVRTSGEFAGGHIANAQNIDYNSADFNQKIAGIDKSKPVFVYCLSGGRSSSAAAQMRADGFKEVYEMNGGTMKWTAAKLPLTTDNTVVKASGMSRADYDKLLKNDKIVLIDFYAEWCGPCKMMKPFLHEISDEMKDKVVVIKIDADQNPELCKDLSIEALPTLFVYKKGVMMWHQVGYAPKEEVVKYLK